MIDYRNFYAISYFSFLDTKELIFRYTKKLFFERYYTKPFNLSLIQQMFQNYS